MAALIYKKDILKPGSSALVVGLGRSGMAAATYLNTCGVNVRVSTSEPVAKIAPQILDNFSRQGIAIEAGGHMLSSFLETDSIIVSPGVDLRMDQIKAACAREIPVVGETALALACCSVPAIGITGTNGKSTVTTLLGEILKKNGKRAFVGGNLGTPLFEWLHSEEHADLVVLELSSFQLETFPRMPEAKLDVAMLLNISPDHLGRYESFDEYAKTKINIFSHQEGADTAIINGDDETVLPLLHMVTTPNLLRFGASGDDSHAWFQGSQIFFQHDDHALVTIDCKNTFFATMPNLSNACSALCAAHAMGIAQDPIQQAIQEYTPLDHRIQQVADKNGVIYIDDSKATNIGAVAAALEAMDRPVILIAGGRDKGGDYSLLQPLIEKKVKAALLLGEAKKSMAQYFSHITQVEQVNSMEAAVNRAHDLAFPGDCVLLSPACASFDMYPSYHHRGLDFQQAVHALHLPHTNCAEAVS